MSISTTPVQEAQGSSTTGATTLSITLGAAATSGNVLALTFGGGGAWAGSGVTIASISQTNVTWALVHRCTTNGVFEEWVGVVSGAGGTTITVNYSAASPAAGNGEVSEWSGVDTTTPVDVSGENSGTSTNPATGTITPTGGLNVVMIAAVRRGSTPTSGPTNSFTALTASSNLISAYRVVTSTSGTYSTDWTYAASAAWGLVYMVLKASVSVTVAVPSVGGTGGVNAPTVSVSGSTTVSVGSVGGTGSVNTPTVKVDGTVTVPSVGGTGAVHDIDLLVAEDVYIGSVGGSGDVNVPTVAVNVPVTLGSVGGTGDVHGPTVRVDATQTLPSVGGTGTVHGPSIRVDGTVTLPSAGGTGTVNPLTVTVPGSTTVPIGSVGGSGGVNTPTVSVSLVTMLGSVGGTGGVHVPTIRVDCVIVLGSVGGSGGVHAMIVQIAGGYTLLPLTITSLTGPRYRVDTLRSGPRYTITRRS